ncbi:hypothetical protein JX265_009777 [Neoarthrinium moseri]|uniref:Fe2OG dioxygenase domain-containing protein n=1 Tax=Neoarthrinium moseri TaxID=1658444 RepID=A0A9P9WFI0_9PEZI|nr:uncharacterized protein JN550_013490 [Neoarthrinium moseri]KAI1840868.1 hypothetical protein JX266_012950 [Neoarthrinium moseri]KAI1856997.1 hypothetical protein JN550_013490 [Neoarthrinium moseri]KAI1861158.1 hypothetical protein JX265_009777 [Neoarthrinium moseri]
MTSVHSSPLKEAQFHTLNLSSLLSRDEDELASLLAACENDGFFYLDLRNWESGKILRQLDVTGQIMKRWFTEPLEQKLKTETATHAHGYKPLGLHPGVTENSRDGFEALRLGRVNLLNQTHLPDVVTTHLDEFQQLQNSAHYILLSLLECLSYVAVVQDQDRYELYHPSEQTSKTSLLFLHYPADDASEHIEPRGHNSHTDAGTLTFLFVESPGLQVLSPKTNDWEYVTPKPGHAIINVADTLRFVSKKRFRSVLHRVLPPGGKMVADRYSTAYFLRAGDKTVFQGLNGEKFTAEEWFVSKYDSFKKTLREQESNPVATGGMAQDLGVRIY